MRLLIFAFLIAVAHPSILLAQEPVEGALVASWCGGGCYAPDMQIKCATVTSLSNAQCSNHDPYEDMGGNWTCGAATGKEEFPLDYWLRQVKPVTEGGSECEVWVWKYCKRAVPCRAATKPRFVNGQKVGTERICENFGGASVSLAPRIDRFPSGDACPDPPVIGGPPPDWVEPTDFDLGIE